MNAHSREPIILPRRLVQIMGLLSLTRVYNIALIAAVQCVSVVFFWGEGDYGNLLDVKFWVLVLCSWVCVGAGYIINFFYDKEKDRFNSPFKSLLNDSVPQSFTLKMYVVMNLLAVLASIYVSYRSALFFSAYIFMIWLYCHKVKKYPLLSNFFMAALGIIPLFAVMIYKRGFDLYMIIPHGLFIYMILLLLSLLGDMKNVKGDAVIGARTVPVLWGEKRARHLAVCVMLISSVVSGVVYVYEKGSVFALYYMLMCVFFIVSSVVVSYSSRQETCRVLHRLLKVLVLLGLLCIPMREWDL